MNIDFHSHCKLSKKAALDMDMHAEMLEEAKAHGLQAIACTEHFNTKNFDEIYDTFDQRFVYRDHYYDADGIKIFPGMEVDIRETGHILLIGDRNDIREIRRRLAAHTDEDHFIPLSELLNIASSYHLLKIGAHPLRHSTPLHHLPPEMLKQLDAFDLNAKDLCFQGREVREGVEALAEKIGIPVVAGSDSHHPLQFGSVKNRLMNDCRTVDDLIREIKNQRYQMDIHPCLDTKVKAAKAVKKVLKAAWNV